ncbi:MAG: 50S ribosomal protein L4 [Victivallaceae bacterium]|nr:50S ribosomal protein L4 [Victivallaceae bacterium]
MSNTLDILDCTGAKVGEYAIPEGVIEMEKGTQAVHDAVVAYLAGQRAGTACTKTRGEVTGGGAKPFRQKGRGAARAGSSRNPVWTGGGVAFGPRPRSFAKKINKKVLVLALKRALSERINEGNVIVLDKFALADHKTKSAFAVLKAIKVADQSVLLSVPELDEATVCATGNLANLVLRTASTVNTYELMRFNKLVFTKDALDAFIGRLA